MSPRTQKCAKCGDSRLPADLVLRKDGMVCADSANCETAEQAQTQAEDALTTTQRNELAKREVEEFDRYEELQERGS